ncbi:hypothetical protein FTUN_8102 [Frigoriglobus tundricola]|uniref:Uncharacterized protein n=1 Tax=Frigoriglobus tundricola TaxID=2774151 RepID=A0A6M5Z4P1_9BACT|nr:hypothetical protein FTUN_8102 [Frigoriglobus tundricola]
MKWQELLECSVVVDDTLRGDDEPRANLPRIPFGSFAQ